MNALLQPRISLEAYLEWENAQVEKHEFHRGEVSAMVGGRRVHGRVVSNISGELRNRLKGSPCQVFSESMKVQIGEETVLSPSTQSYDRSQKFALYRRIPSLREYILVDPDTRRVEGFRRDEKGQWVLHDMSDGSSLEAASIGTSVPLVDVFAGVDPPAAEA